MTKSEAMRRVCSGAEAILNNDSENLWLIEDDEREPLPETDQRRMLRASDALCSELRRRAGK